MSLYPYPDCAVNLSGSSKSQRVQVKMWRMCLGCKSRQSLLLKIRQDLLSTFYFPPFATFFFFFFFFIDFLNLIYIVIGFFLSCRIVWPLPYKSLLTSKNDLTELSNTLRSWLISRQWLSCPVTAKKKTLPICPWLAINRYEISFCFLKWVFPTSLRLSVTLIDTRRQSLLKKSVTTSAAL